APARAAPDVRDAPPGRVLDHDEVEWQLEARDLRGVQRWLRAAPPGFTIGTPTVDVIRDTYYDTADWRLHRAGCALRPRRVGDRVEATMKWRGSTARGPERRRELTVPLAATLGRAPRPTTAAPDPGPLAAIERVPAPLAVWLSVVAGRHPLRAVIALR